jgi:hypothetical protein
VLGDSLVVELSALDRAALVRIQVPQPRKYYLFTHIFPNIQNLKVWSEHDRLKLVASYLCLAPILFLLNKHHLPLKVFLLGCGILSLWLWRRGDFKRPSKVFQLALANLAFSFGIVVWSHLQDVSSLKFHDMWRYCYKIVYVAGFASLIYWVALNRALKPFFETLKVCAVIGALGALSFYSPRVSIRLELCGLAHHSILGASIYGAIGVLAFYDALSAKLRGAYFWNLAVFLICSGVVVLTMSRGPLFAYGLTVFLAALYHTYNAGRGLRKAPFLLLLSLFFGYSLLQVGLYLIMPQLRVLLGESENLWLMILKVIVPIRSLASGDSYRLYIWWELLKDMKHHLFFGIGYAEILSIDLPGAHATVNHPHSLYVSKLCREGIVGFSMLLGLLVTAGRKAIHFLFRSVSDLGGLASLLFIHALLSCVADTSSLWDGKNLEMILFFWFPVMFLAGVDHDPKQSVSYSV